MIRTGKILLSVLSWLPLVWTFLALLAAKLCYTSHTGFAVFYPLKKVIILLMMFYVLYGGFMIWAFLNLFFRWKNVITKKQFLYNIALTVSGMLAAYLSLHYDIFGLSGSYID